MRPIIGKEARARRRRGRTQVRDARTEDLLRMLTERDSMPAGFFNPDTGEVVMFPGADDSVLEHEMIHSEQFGPLRNLLGFNPRVQDRQTRRAIRGITNRMDTDAFKDAEGFNPLQYMIENPIEFEAIVRSAVTSPESEGLDFRGDFDDILQSLISIPRDQSNTNLRLLASAMSQGNFDDRQKDLFLRAIRSNLNR
tara:strand:- start:1111 stop:1698 length:588 start_codon:yes stop_codon:yes gene_type:complete